MMLNKRLPKRFQGLNAIVTGTQILHGISEIVSWKIWIRVHRSVEDDVVFPQENWHIPANDVNLHHIVRSEEVIVDIRIDEEEVLLDITTIYKLEIPVLYIIYDSPGFNLFGRRLWESLLLNTFTEF